jgi:hypothetical protein
MGDLENALNAYENALRHNPMSLAGLTQVAGIARIKENYPKVSIQCPFFVRLFLSRINDGTAAADDLANFCPIFRIFPIRCFLMT